MIRTLKGDEKTNELISFITNHEENIGLRVMTKAIFVTLDHLKDFISQVEDKHNKSIPGECDAIKICFGRFEFKPNSRQILAAGKDLKEKELTQVSLIFVPVKTADRSKSWESTELFKNDGLLALCVCEPAVDDQNNTGLCPPNEGCPKGPGE